MHELNPHLHAGRNWLPHAFLDLSSREASSDRMASWLHQALQSLNLTEDFLKRVLNSLHGAASVAIAEETNVRLLVYLLSLPSKVYQTWGFFQTVKMKATQENSTGSTYEIAVYLYGEGGSSENGS